MTATPTPLRERGPMVGTMLESDFTKDTITFHMPATYYAAAGRYIIEPEADWLRRKEQAEAALSARDAAGADFWRQFALPPLPQCWTGAPVSVTWEEDGETTTREVYTAEQMASYANAAVEAALLAAATPPAASGDDPVGELIEAVLAERLTRRSGTGAEHSSATARVTAALLAVGDARRLAAVAPAGMDGWQPIETAPKDGRRVLLRFKNAQALPQRGDGFGGIPFVGAWTGQYTQWGFAAPVGMGGFPDDWLDGWQPLPSAPAQEGEGA